jgi:hypothetical protein
MQRDDTPMSTTLDASDRSFLKRCIQNVAVGFAVAVVVGCSSSSVDTGRSDPGTAGTGGALSADQADAHVGTAACGRYYAAQYSRCGGPQLPADEESRVRDRFVRSCESEMGLPGSGMTSASVAACASALSASPCDLPAGPPPACDFHGFLAGGAPCSDGFQCASGACMGTAYITPGGQDGPSTCGTCAPVAALGAACGDIAECAAGTLCITKDTSAAQPVYTCTAVTLGGVDAACDDLTARCAAGLYCSSQTGQCAPLAVGGAACGEGSRDYTGGCEPPAACVGLPGSRKCSSGAKGAFCLTDTECARGLGCVPGPCIGPSARVGCAPSGTCQPVTWASPGEACDGFVRRCLRGGCPTMFGQLPDGGLASGVCPQVVADEAPCSVATLGAGPSCDVFAECFDPTGPAGRANAAGKCVLQGAHACR